MIDTGSTYNVASRKFLKKHIYAAVPIPESRGRSDHTLLLGDGVSTVTIQGKMVLTVQFQTTVNEPIIIQIPFCIIDHSIPQGLILGHRFFMYNPGFDLSYEHRWIKVKEYFIPWVVEQGLLSPMLLGFQETFVFPPRTTRIAEFQVHDKDGRPMQNQFGIITNVDSAVELQLPTVSFGFTSSSGFIKVPITNFGFETISVSTKIAVFTPADPLCHQVYSLNEKTERIELQNIRQDEPKELNERSRRGSIRLGDQATTNICKTTTSAVLRTSPQRTPSTSQIPTTNPVCDILAKPNIPSSTGPLVQSINIPDNLEPNLKRLKMAFRPNLAPIPETSISPSGAKSSQDFVDKLYRLARPSNIISGKSPQTSCANVSRGTPITTTPVITAKCGTSEKDIRTSQYQSVKGSHPTLGKRKPVVVIPCDSKQDRCSSIYQERKTPESQRKYLKVSVNALDKITEKVTPSLDIPVGPEDQIAFDTLSDLQKTDIKRIMKDHPILSIRTALEIVRQPQAAMTEVPDYFEGDELSDKKLPAFLKGFCQRIDTLL